MTIALTTYHSQPHARRFEVLSGTASASSQTHACTCRSERGTGSCQDRGTSPFGGAGETASIELLQPFFSFSNSTRQRVALRALFETFMVTTGVHFSHHVQRRPKSQTPRTMPPHSHLQIRKLFGSARFAIGHKSMPAKASGIGWLSVLIVYAWGDRQRRPILQRSLFGAPQLYPLAGFVFQHSGAALPNINADGSLLAYRTAEREALCAAIFGWRKMRAKIFDVHARYLATSAYGGGDVLALFFERQGTGTITVFSAPNCRARGHKVSASLAFGIYAFVVGTDALVHDVVGKAVQCVGKITIWVFEHSNLLCSAAVLRLAMIGVGPARAAWKEPGAATGLGGCEAGRQRIMAIAVVVLRSPGTHQAAAIEILAVSA